MRIRFQFEFPDTHIFWLRSPAGGHHQKRGRSRGVVDDHPSLLLHYHPLVGDQSSPHYGFHQTDRRPKI